MSNQFQKSIWLVINPRVIIESSLETVDWAKGNDINDADKNQTDTENEVEPPKFETDFLIVEGTDGKIDSLDNQENGEYQRKNGSKSQIVFQEEKSQKNLQNGWQQNASALRKISFKIKPVQKGCYSGNKGKQTDNPGKWNEGGHRSADADDSAVPKHKE